MSPKQIRRYLKSGKLPSIKIGKLRRISEADLEKFLDDRKHRGDDWQSRKTLSVA
jgi:excisionase family DNA binding protein